MGFSLEVHEEHYSMSSTRMIRETGAEVMSLYSDPICSVSIAISRTESGGGTKRRESRSALKSLSEFRWSSTNYDVAVRYRT